MPDPTIWAQAKAEIQRRGWHQGSYVRWDTSAEYAKSLVDGPVCLVGAVNTAVTDSPDEAADDVHLRSIGEAVRATGFTSEYGDWVNYVADWNDVDGRTVDEVYALLDELDASERSTP
jgi:hypothetical protein